MSNETNYAKPSIHYLCCDALLFFLSYYLLVLLDSECVPLHFSTVHSLVI